MKYLIIIMMMINIVVYSIAGESSFGTTNAQFLKVPFGSRAIGMSSTYISNGQDIFGVYYNPSLLVHSTNSSEVAVQYNNWFGDVSQQFFSYHGKQLSYDIALLFMSVDIDETPFKDINGYYLSRGDSISDFNYILGINWSQLITSSLSYGVQFKGVVSQFPEKKSWTVAFDFGITHKLKYFDYGISLKNFGLPLKYKQNSYKLPIDLGIGISKRWLENKDLSTAIDFHYSIDNEPYFNIGVEYIVFDFLTLRTGTRINQNYFNNISFGIGINIMNVNLDYSFVFTGPFNNIQLMSMKYNW